MRFPPAPHVTAGLLFLLAAGFAGTIWFIYLFVATPSGHSFLDSVLGQLQFTFSVENKERWWFAWMAALPIACGLLGAAYLFNVPRFKPVGIVLLGLSIALAIASFTLNDWSLAIFVALPIAWAYRCVNGT